MQIDWLTVVAQIVNFLLLVWLLKHFLYKPITNAMRRREERIEERLAEAKAARAEADAEVARLRERKAALEADRERMLENARREAEELQNRLEAEVREQMEDKRQAWRDHLKEERDAFVASIRRQAGQKVLDVTERVLSDYADSQLTERVSATFVKQLEALGQEKRDKLIAAAVRQDGPAIIQTGTDIDSAAKGRITREIHEILSTEIEVDYQRDPDLVLGIRLTLGENSVEWSVARYLARLETEIGEIIDAGSSHSMETAQQRTRNVERTTT